MLLHGAAASGGVFPRSLGSEPEVELMHEPWIRRVLVTSIIAVLIAPVLTSVGAANLLPKVDLRIYDPKTNLSIGDDVYSADGSGQTLLFKARQGKTRTFEVVCGNDGAADDGIVLTASKPRGYKVTYRFYSGTVDVTSEVYGSGFTLDSQAPGNSWVVYMDVTPKATAPEKGSWLVTGTSTTNGSVSDSVGFKVRMRT
jgi:hypothetical protein